MRLRLTTWIPRVRHTETESETEMPDFGLIDGQDASTARGRISRYFPGKMRVRGAAGATARLAPRHLRDVVGDRLRVVARLELRRHPPGARAADADRALDALRGDLADLVEVGPGDALGPGGL